MAERTYTFGNIQELYQTADQLPEADRHGVYAHHEERDEWEPIGWRDSLWLDGYGAVGDVSASDDYYNVIQYGEILESVGDAVEQYDGAIDVEGTVAISSSGHQMSSRVDFYGDTTIEPVDGDEINLGLQVRSGHSGYHGVKYDIGAERLVCSNGMVAFVDEMQFEQTHQDPLNPGLAQHAVDAVVEGTDEVEERLQRAREETFRDVDEALLVLYDFGLDQYFEEPRDVFRDALRAEVSDEAEPGELLDDRVAEAAGADHGDVGVGQCLLAVDAEGADAPVEPVGIEVGHQSQGLHLFGSFSESLSILVIVTSVW